MGPSADRGPTHHVVLVGLMGTGKTTLGRRLAARLGRPFLDSDQQVEQHTGHTVRELFETEGEPCFRKLEAEVLAEALASPTPTVVAAAGGVVIDPQNRARLRRAGTVVWLRAAPAFLAARTQSQDHRPLLDPDPLAALTRMAHDREAWYAEVADHVIDVDQTRPADLLDTVLGWVA